MQKPITDSSKISPFLVFFIVNSMQVGIGVLGFQKYIAKDASYDAWVCIILSGIAVSILIWMSYHIMRGSQGDIVYVNKQLLGKFLGSTISILFIAYLMFTAFTVLRTYIEIVQVWMFPNVSTHLVAGLFLFLVYYISSGGFRSIVGISYFGIVIPFYLVFTVFFPLEYVDFDNMLPLFDAKLSEYLKGTRTMSLSMLGFESILLFYPFVHNAFTSHKYAQFANFLTTLLYLLLGVLSFGYFSEGQLLKTIWATLSLWKIVELPLAERFEYIGIANWAIIIMPIICLWLWGASRMTKHLLPKIRQKTILFLFLVVVFSLIGFIDTRSQIDTLNNLVSQIGFYFVCSYIVFLFILKKIKSMRGTKNETSSNI